MSGEEPPPPYDRVVIHIPQETGTYCRCSYQKVSNTVSFDFNKFSRQLMVKFLGEKKYAGGDVYLNFLLVDGRIRILEDQKQTDPTDPKHCFFPCFASLPEKRGT